MQWRASVPGLDMPRSCSFHHQKPLEAARCSPALNFTEPSRSLEKVCDPCIVLPHVKQVKTLILKGCRTSKRNLPSPSSFQHVIWMQGGLCTYGQVTGGTCCHHLPAQEDENAPNPQAWQQEPALGTHKCTIAGGNTDFTNAKFLLLL